MELKHEQTNTRGIFYLEENNERVAIMTYVFDGDAKFIIEHTVVNPGHEGKGLGKQLVDAAVEFARKNNYKIVPVCPYAQKVMSRSDVYKDVL